MEWLRDNWQSTVLIWVGTMSLLNFFLMGVDKHRAKRGGWRVRERTFFLAALLGGALGGWLGMYTFRHKTRHWYFKWGLPAIMVLQIGLAVLLMHRYGFIPAPA